jgi:hypothetical protein
MGPQAMSTPDPLHRTELIPVAFAIAIAPPKPMPNE